MTLRFILLAALPALAACDATTAVPYEPPCFLSGEQAARMASSASTASGGVLEAGYSSGGCVTVTFDETLSVPPGEATAGTLTFADGQARLALNVFSATAESQVRVRLEGTFDPALAPGSVATEPFYLRRSASLASDPPAISEWDTTPDLVTLTLTGADLLAGRVTGEFRVLFDAGATYATYSGTFDAPITVVGAP